MGEALRTRRLKAMSQAYTAVITQQDDFFVGWIEEVPGVNCQERTRDELLVSLREALGEALVFNRQEALSAAGEEYFEERIAL